MRKVHALGLVLVLMLIGAATATAKAPGSLTCNNGTIDGGTWGDVTVVGTCAFADGATITINGNVTVTDGSTLNDHAMSDAGVTINGNVKVGKGGVIGLGTYGPPGPNGPTTVNGNVIGDAPASLYLGGMTVNGNVVSNGGGSPFRNFPVKDDTISGNLIIQGWHGFWVGAIRDTVGGNVIFNHNSGSIDPSTGTFANPDTDEVANNDISGNLICQQNDPAAQLGDTGQPPSRVGGNSVGECAGL